MEIIYSSHARDKLRERGITELDAEHILKFPDQVRRSYYGRMVAMGHINFREIKVVFVKKEKYIKIVTVI